MRLGYARVPTTVDQDFALQLDALNGGRALEE